MSKIFTTELQMLTTCNTIYHIWWQQCCRTALLSNAHALLHLARDAQCVDGFQHHRSASHDVWSWSRSMHNLQDTPWDCPDNCCRRPPKADGRKYSLAVGRAAPERRLVDRDQRRNCILPIAWNLLFGQVGYQLVSGSQIKWKATCPLCIQCAIHCIAWLPFHVEMLIQRAAQEVLMLSKCKDSWLWKKNRRLLL